MTLENEELCGGDLALPGAGELIMGPTVLGEVMAAGNLIWASPPYLFREHSVWLGHTFNTHDLLDKLNMYLKKALVAHCETSRSQAALEQARMSAVAQACSSCQVQ